MGYHTSTHEVLHDTHGQRITECADDGGECKAFSQQEKSHNQHDGVDDENKDGGGNAKLSIEEKSDTGSSAGNQTGTRDEQYKAGGIHNVADNDHQQFYHVFCSSTHSIHFLTPIICNFA